MAKVIKVRERIELKKRSTAPRTPSSNCVVLYADNTGAINKLDSTGSVTPIEPSEEGGSSPQVKALTSAVLVTNASYSTPVDLTTAFTVAVGTYLLEAQYYVSTPDSLTSLAGLGIKYSGTATFTAASLGVSRQKIQDDDTVVALANVVPSSNNANPDAGFPAGVATGLPAILIWRQTLVVTEAGTFKIQATIRDDEFGADDFSVDHGFARLTLAS